MLRFALIDGEAAVDVRSNPRHWTVTRTTASQDLSAYDGVINLVPGTDLSDLSSQLPVLTTATDLDPPQLDAWLQQPARLSLAQPHRYGAYARTLRAELDRGCLGAPGLVRSHHWRSTQDVPPDTTPGDFLRQLLVADLDLACWLLSAQPMSVYARAHEQDGEVRNLQVQLRFPHAMAVLDVAVVPESQYRSLSVIGACGAAYADDHRNTNLLLRQGCTGIRFPLESDWLAPQLDAFANIVAGREDDHSLLDLQSAFILAQAVVESAATGKAAQQSGDTYVLT